MNDILDELWYGNISPSEDYVSKNEEHRDYLRNMGKALEAIDKELSPSQKELMNQYENALNQLYDLCEKEAFKYGFRLARDLFEK